MASKYQLITSLYEQAIKQATFSPADWTSFLCSACRNYKCRFDEQILIFVQRADATAVLKFDDWHKKFGRKNAIILLKLNGQIIISGNPGGTVFLRLVLVDAYGNRRYIADMSPKTVDWYATMGASQYLLGGNTNVASSKQILDSVFKEAEDNVGKTHEDMNHDLLSEHMYAGNFLSLEEGVRVKILQIDGEYAKFLVLDGKHIGTEFWTFKKYLEEY